MQPQQYSSLHGGTFPRTVASCERENIRIQKEKVKWHTCSMNIFFFFFLPFLPVYMPYLDQTGASPLRVGHCCGGSEPPQQELAEISNSV